MNLATRVPDLLRSSPGSPRRSTASGSRRSSPARRRRRPGSRPGDAILAINGHQFDVLRRPDALDDLQENVGKPVDAHGPARERHARDGQVTLRSRAEIDARRATPPAGRRRARSGISGGADGFVPVFYDTTAATCRRRSGSARSRRPTRSALILDGLGDLVGVVVNQPDGGAAGRRPDRDRDPGRRRLLAARADLHALPRGHPVGQPRPRQHPAVPAARRRADADDRPEGDLRRSRISLRAERLTYLVGFVVPVGVPRSGSPTSTSPGSSSGGPT